MSNFVGEAVSLLRAALSFVSRAERRPHRCHGRRFLGEDWSGQHRKSCGDRLT